MFRYILMAVLPMRIKGYVSAKFSIAMESKRRYAQAVSEPEQSHDPSLSSTK